MKKLSVFLLATAFALTASAAVNSKDRKTMEKLGQGESSEVDLAKIVEPKATSADVKEFARRMISDHGKAFDKLERLAKEEKVSLKSGMDKEHKKFAATLAKEKLGAAYDRTYMAEMVKDHRKDKSDIDKAIKQTKNAELKAWEREALETVTGHLKMAEEIRAKLK
ncbi:MAG TPA: DUF4142 domain-containing protein [Thermoanaerobaculia bacterium]|nr:DUF4142 domain-containing protein [Thermoanaerobaculia bacterium]